MHLLLEAIVVIIDLQVKPGNTSSSCAVSEYCYYQYYYYYILLHRYDYYTVVGVLKI